MGGLECGRGILRESVRADFIIVCSYLQFLRYDTRHSVDMTSLPQLPPHEFEAALQCMRWEELTVHCIVI